MRNLNHGQGIEKNAGEGTGPTTPFQLMSVTELARKLGVPPVTIYSWKRRGKIPYLQLERCIRFDLAEIQAWLEQRKQGPGVEKP